MIPPSVPPNASEVVSLCAAITPKMTWNPLWMVILWMIVALWWMWHQSVSLRLSLRRWYWNLTLQPVIFVANLPVTGRCLGGMRHYEGPRPWQQGSALLCAQDVHPLEAWCPASLWSQTIACLHPWSDLGFMAGSQPWIGWLPTGHERCSRG